TSVMSRVGFGVPIATEKLWDTFYNFSVAIGTPLRTTDDGQRSLLHRAVIGRFEVDGFDLLDQHAVLVALLVDLAPFGVLAERLPRLLGRLATGEGDQVDELAALAVLLIQGRPEPDELGAVLLQ